MALDELSVPGKLQELWPEFLESRRQSEEWENWALGQQTSLRFLTAIQRV